jgi:prophage endopeptidase
MNPRTISALVLVLGVFASGWTANGWRLGKQHEQERAKRAEFLNQQGERIRKDQEETLRKIAELDKEYTEKLTKARHENQALADRLATGAVRLRIAATCPADTDTTAKPAESSGMDTPTSAVLSASAGQTYSALRDNIITTENTLSACQKSFGELVKD